MNHSSPDGCMETHGWALSLFFCCPTGVFGTLELYGLPHNVYHSKLAATAAAGSNSLKLAQSVDWQVSVVLLYLLWTQYFVLNVKILKAGMIITKCTFEL